MRGVIKAEVRDGKRVPKMRKHSLTSVQLVMNAHMKRWKRSARPPAK